MFLDYYEIKLEINNINIDEKPSNIWKSKNRLLNNSQVNEVEKIFKK